jgi:hypothetical protein
MRIRIKSLPDPGEMDEYDLRRYRPGDVYDVPAHLASLLILSGHAEPVSGGLPAAEAADYNRPRKP